MDSKQIELARKFDLTNHFFDFVDRHLMYPLLDNLVTIYDVKEVDNLQFNVLKDTYMTKELKELYLSINPNEKDLPTEYLNRENDIINELVPLNESTKETLNILCSKEIQSNLKQNKIENRELIKTRGIDDDKILELYKFGKLQYNRGDYVMASDLLNNFKLLSINQDLILKATCGKFISDILSGDIEEAKNEMINLRDVIDNRNYQGSSIDQLKLRNWLIHNSLFIFFNENDLKKQSINGNINLQLLNMNEIFLSSSYISTIEASCPWILRYIISSVLYTKDFKRLKDIIKAVEIENYEYNDPFTNLIQNLFIDFKFNKLNEILNNIEILIEIDFFINHLSKDEFINNIIELIIRSVLKIYKKLSINQLFKFVESNLCDLNKLNEIINKSNELKINIENNIVSLNDDENINNPYFTVYEKTKALSFKSNQFLNNASINSI
ncbi:hypothetical protein DAPK24_024900 [Pichia kluyveri]|uniref:PCI domain-containing protein n=1 Tax=Pichia kluyveri TaxID=36015 RepID=A0AAV5R3Q9_PICKL|nr:hypothetical protein DAPK24_024900 [Pichia kluyveri]